jgi:NAD(P)H-hydrate epimerase
MLPVLDNDAMRDADRHTIDDLGLPGLVLMENAATGVVDVVRDAFPEAHSLLILCGGGNNGGDGLAAARHLHNGGHEVEVLLFADPERLSADAKSNLDVARAIHVPVHIVEGEDLGSLDAALEAGRDLVVDALLGTGIDRPLGGRLQAAAERVLAAGTPVVAVDVPSGLNGSLSTVPGPVLDADITVTFGALKVCHTLPPACHRCGDVAVVDIGIPPSVLEAQCRRWWVERGDAELLLPDRARDAHKGRFGHVLLIAGSEGRGGAVALAANAAVVAGAGLVTMAVPQPVVPVVDAACLEAMTHPIAVTATGEIRNPDALAPALERATVAAVGPGMGTGDGAARTLEWVLEHWPGPLVLDADAINLLAGRGETLAGRSIPAVLTPHPGELARFLDTSIDDVVDDRVGAAREAAAAARSVVVAKGFRSVIADPGGEVWINPTGDAALASGGSGDVLTGTVAAMLAHGLDPDRAATVACWLHGRAGELGSADYPAAVPAGALPELIARAWRELAPQ